jgi:hypothetical protein
MIRISDMKDHENDEEMDDQRVKKESTLEEKNKKVIF